MDFKCKTPCKNCPYRKDSPLALWSIKEFIELIEHERSQFGKVYACHKKNGGVCVGWLIRQDEDGFPSIALRMMLSQKNIDRKYLDALYCKSEMFKTVEEMAVANFPEIENIIENIPNENNHGYTKRK